MLATIDVGKAGVTFTHYICNWSHTVYYNYLWYWFWKPAL